MSKSNTFETEYLLLMFNNVAIPDIGDAAGLQPSVADGDFFVALHTADPGEAGDQSTNEADYTGYARLGIVRTAAGWTVAGDQVTNAALAVFAPCTAGANTITHFSIGVAASGATKILYSGQLTAPLPVAAGVTPEFAIGAVIGTED